MLQRHSKGINRCSTHYCANKITHVSAASTGIIPCYPAIMTLAILRAFAGQNSFGPNFAELRHAIVKKCLSLSEIASINSPSLQRSSRTLRALAPPVFAARRPAVGTLIRLPVGIAFSRPTSPAFRAAYSAPTLAAAFRWERYCEPSIRIFSICGGVSIDCVLIIAMLSFL